MGKGHFNEDNGQATGWDSMWQRFMRRMLKDTKTTERFTEHHLRGKVGSDLASIERATDPLGHASRKITKRHCQRPRSDQARPLSRASLVKIRIVAAGNLRNHSSFDSLSRMGDCEFVIHRLFAASNYEFD
jgi:hypothetical protein